MGLSKHNVLIYLFAKTLNHKSPLLIFFAVLTAIFCLPVALTHADFFPITESFFTKMQKQIALDLKKDPQIMKIVVTAYSSRAEETDDTPCITATGYDLCKHNVENVVACNFLPFGTKVIFPELDPDKIYTVVDRMHERFNSRMDIWMKSHHKAQKFGKKYLTIEIYKQ